MRIKQISFNFLDKYYLFYNWLKDDKVIVTSNYHVVKVSSKVLGDLIKYQVKADLEDGIYVFSDSFSYVSLKFEDKVSKYISSLTLEDEEKLKNKVDSLKYTKIEYAKLAKREVDNNLRYLEKIKSVINKKVSNIQDEDMLKYIYYEWFSKKEDNLNVIMQKIKERLEKEITPKEKEIYDLLLVCGKGV